MRQIVQCVPNISEGRRLDVVERIVDEIRQTEECSFGLLLRS